MPIASPIASDIPPPRLYAKPPTYSASSASSLTTSSSLSAAPAMSSSTSTLPSPSNRSASTLAPPTAARSRPFFEISDGEDVSSNSSDEREGVRVRQLTEEPEVSLHEIKRWNALMEIVHTEAGYVHDLRALVNIYFAVLPSLPLSEPAHQVVTELSQATRALLQLHERFLTKLQEASSKAVTATSPGVEEAMGRVAGLFVMEAPSFDVYQHYCSTQPDAVRLLKPAQARAEWEAFEHICAKGDPTATTTIPDTPPSPTKSRIPRTLSMVPTSFRVYGPATFFTEPLPQSTSPPSFYQSRLTHNVRSQSFDSGLTRASLNVSPPSPPPLSETTTTSSSSSSLRMKLRFQDFLIKPIQRICKYPLMLEGLRTKHAHTHTPKSSTLIDHAISTMRAVAARVDDARRLQASLYQTRLILERLDASSSSSPPFILSPSFLESLGTCVLAGSLDVVHHHHVWEPVGREVRVRYLGVFLFEAGYVVMVKVKVGGGGGGVVYRMKHWFGLAGGKFEVVDIPAERAIVPHSFRLSCEDHHFEMAAASEGEKAIWMRAMREAAAQLPRRQNAGPSRTSEPMPSFQVHRPPTPMSPCFGATATGMSVEVKPLELMHHHGEVTPGGGAGVPAGGSTARPRSRVLSTSTTSRISLRLPSRHRGGSSQHHQRAPHPHPGQRVFSIEQGGGREGEGEGGGGVGSSGAGLASASGSGCTVGSALESPLAPSVLIRRSSRSERESVERELEDVMSDVITAVRAKERVREEGWGGAGAAAAAGRTRVASVAATWSSSVGDSSLGASVSAAWEGSSMRAGMARRGHNRKSLSTGAVGVGADVSIPERDESDAPHAKLKRSFSLAARNRLAKSGLSKLTLAPKTGPPHCSGSTPVVAAATAFAEAAAPSPRSSPLLCAQGEIAIAPEPAEDHNNDNDTMAFSFRSPATSETGHTNANPSGSLHGGGGSPKLTRSLVGSVRGFVRRATLKKRDTMTSTTSAGPSLEDTGAGVEIGDDLTDEGVLVEMPLLVQPVAPVLPVLAHLREGKDDHGVRVHVEEKLVVAAGGGGGGAVALGRRQLRRSMLFT